MRLVAWNIRAGGGKRRLAIQRALLRWRPDLIVLSEYRGTPPSVELAAWLAKRGLRYQRSTALAQSPAVNALLIASRNPLTPIATPSVVDETRLLGAATATENNEPLALTAVHVPNRVTGRKFEFLDAVTSHASTAASDVPALIVGDTNSGRRCIDEQSSAFILREERWFDELAAHGFVDAFRELHGERRAYTWYSPNGDNGFRLDQLFANAALMRRLRSMEYRWASRGRKSGVSDHAAIIADF